MCVKRGTIREERPDLLKYLVNEEDGELTCGSGKKIEVKCPECNRVKEIKVCDFNRRGFSCDNIHCSLCKNSKEYLYNLNEIINGLKIIKQTHNGKKRYVVQCIKDGYKYEITEDNLKYGNGCPVCDGKKVIIGINDIATSHLNVIRYLKHKEDGFKYSAGSSKKVIVICPICKQEKEITVCKLTERKFTCNNKACINYFKNKSKNTYQKNKIKDGNYLNITHPQLIKYLKNKEDRFKSKGSKEKITVVCPICKTEQTIAIHNLVRLGFSCQTCGDGNSYPNKFMEYLLIQSEIEFFNEQRFAWSTNKDTYKIYDVYIPRLNCIIENHGGQHYLSSGFTSLGGRSLEDEQINDKLKKELAFKNGIQNYFEIDCRKSELNWIKKSIVNSGLLKLLNTNENNVNWLECHKYAIKSKVIIACDSWNKGCSVKDISNNLLVHSVTIQKYLQQGKELGLCNNYNNHESKSRSHKNHRGKQVFIDNCIFGSVTECAKFHNENQSTVSRWIRGERKTPQKYIDLGLRYATEEDLNTYELYQELN